MNFYPWWCKNYRWYQWTGYKVESTEGEWAASYEIEGGNTGHRPGTKGGYFPVHHRFYGRFKSRNDASARRSRTWSNF